jgi:hypothetical protein
MTIRKASANLPAFSGIHHINGQEAGSSKPWLF